MLWLSCQEILGKDRPKKFRTHRKRNGDRQRADCRTRNARLLRIQRGTPLDLTNELTCRVDTLTLRGSRSANHNDPLPCLISRKPPDINPISIHEIFSLGPCLNGIARPWQNEEIPPESFGPNVARGANAVAPANDRDSWHRRSALAGNGGPDQHLPQFRSLGYPVIPVRRFTALFVPTANNPTESLTPGGLRGAI